MRVSAQVQFIVGLFVVFVIGCFVYMSASIGFKFGSSSNSYYTVTAQFTNINGLKNNAAVKIGGYNIGYVEKIELDDKTMQPMVYLKIDKQYDKLPDSSSLSIKTNGILGDKFLDLTVGFDDPEITTYLTDGSQITNTNSTLEIEDLISKFAFGDK